MKPSKPVQTDTEVLERQPNEPGDGLKYRFYMVRLTGGIWEPKIKHGTLAQAMEAACAMAQKHASRATILKSVSSVEIVDGKPVWTDRTPKA
jgi:hypothetical protein